MRAFKIGIFTTFLVVMVITMLKSVVASSPLLFVKIGQDAVGAIDFDLKSPETSNAMTSGNVNYNSINPFDNPYALKGGESYKMSKRSSYQGELIAKGRSPDTQIYEDKNLLLEIDETT